MENKQATLSDIKAAPTVNPTGPVTSLAGEVLAEFENIKFIKKNKKCCIVGFAPSWSEAPYGAEDTDFWGINELYRYLDTLKPLPQFHAWFEIHNIKESPSKQNEGHQAFLKSCKIPLVTQRHWKEYPMSIPYPRLYIKHKINGHFIKDEKHEGFSDYSNQITWMIALAIQLGYEEIAVYGVDMAQESEYAFQRASCQFFLGYAAGKGIKLKIPASCELLKAGADYGFKTDNKNRFRKKNKISGIYQQMESINIRQSQIVHAHTVVDKHFDQHVYVIDADIAELNKIITNLKTHRAVCNALISAFSTMPDTKNNKIEKLIQSQLDKQDKDLVKVEADILEMEKKLKSIKEKREKWEIDTAVNHTLLDKEFEANKVTLNTLQGMIKEANHDLNNNLV